MIAWLDDPEAAIELIENGNANFVQSLTRRLDSRKPERQNYGSDEEYESRLNDGKNIRDKLWQWKKVVETCEENP